MKAVDYRLQVDWEMGDRRPCFAPNLADSGGASQGRFAVGDGRGLAGGGKWKAEGLGKGTGPGKTCEKKGMAFRLKVKGGRLS
jgi:hypothetical protein